MAKAEVKYYNVGPATRERYDAIIRKAAKDAGVVIEHALDKRHSSRPATDESYGWSAFERYLCDGGRTIFFSLDTETATVSDKPNPVAVRKVKALQQRKAERAARKEAREKKAAERKAAKDKAAAEKKPADKK